MTRTEVKDKLNLIFRRDGQADINGWVIKDLKAIELKERALVVGQIAIAYSKIEYIR